jgi:hypothetical protein
VPASPTRAIVRLTLLEALRTRLPAYLAVLAAAGLGLAVFLGAMAVTEGAQVRAGVLGSLLRLGAVVLTALFVVASVHRELEGRATEMLLSLPVSRGRYYLARLAGFAVTALGVALVATGVVLLQAPPPAAAAWGLALAAELVLVAALAQAAAFSLGQLPGALGAVLAFYLLGRGIGAIQLIAHGPLVSAPGPLNTLATAAIDGLAFLLPDLYRFTRAEWLVHGLADSADLLLVLAQAAVYGPLLAAVGLFDLYRRSF